MAKSDLLLLLNPTQRQALRDAAYRQGVREQVIARSAVLRALSDPIPGNVTSVPIKDLISLLGSLSKQLAVAQRQISDIMQQVDRPDAKTEDAMDLGDAFQSIDKAEDLADELEADSLG
jgi:hypothetical protein